MSELQKDVMENEYLAKLPDTLQSLLDGHLRGASCFELSVFTDWSGLICMTPAVVEYIIEALKQDQE